MAPATRSRTPEGALAHILTNVLTAGQDSTIRQAFTAAGTNTVIDFMELSKADLTELQVGANTRLTITERNVLLAVQGWYRSQPSPTLDTWFELTTDTLQAYRQNAPLAPNTTTTADQTVVSPVTPLNPMIAPPLDYGELFLKGTKRSITDYKVFKDTKQWTIWSRNLLATAAAHGISDVFNPEYKPSTDAETAMFKAAKIFAFSVLTAQIQEPSAQTIVRKYSIAGTDEYGDAQALYKDLVAKFENGIAASLQTSQIESAIMAMKLTNNYNKDITSFLTAWNHKILDLDKYRTEPTTDTWKCERLNSCLMTHNRMNAHVMTLRTQGETLASQLGKPFQAMPFDQYYQSMYNYAMTIDQQTHERQRHQREANVQTQSRTNPGRGQGRGRGNERGGGGRGSQRGRGRGNGSGSNYSDYIPPDKWNKMTPEQKRAHLEKRNKNTPDPTPPTVGGSSRKRQK